MNELNNAKEEIRRLKGLLDLSEKYAKILEIDNEKLTKDLQACQDAYDKCRKIEA